MAALLLRVEDAASQLGLSRSKTYDLISEGRLPSVRLGPRCVRVPAVALDNWIAQQTAPSAGQEVACG